MKTKLDNGLTVILREMNHAPVASFWIWYRVGSRNERPGFTGVSHWVEHMMFKGSPQFPAGSLDRLVSREGGRWNAFTTNDFTAYYETLPAERIDLALRLESDRMLNAIMTREEVDSERMVIISERQMYENHPSFLLHEKLMGEAFRYHPYRHEVIGDLADLESMSQEDLVGHYRHHYVPGNAVIVVAGAFESQQIMVRIEELFGSIPAGSLVEIEPRPEPDQQEEREAIVNGPGETAYLTIAYRAPQGTHPDFYPLVLLNAAFAGGSSLGFFGSGTTNKSSRLYKSLVTTELAAAIYGGLMPTIDPYLYTISAIARPNRSLADIEAALDNEMNHLLNQPVTERELMKALKRAKAQLVMAGESVTGQAQMLGLGEIISGDHHWYEKSLDHLHEVSLEDIDRVRDKYLRREKRTIGRYLPAGK